MLEFREFLDLRVRKIIHLGCSEMIRGGLVALIPNCSTHNPHYYPSLKAGTWARAGPGHWAQKPASIGFTPWPRGQKDIVILKQ